MLDCLKQRPFTTGELCEEFPNLDRCTVMKHLCVLENSDLISFRRQGRNRLNFLNPVQLQKIHTRWLSSYTAQTAQKLLDFKKLAEGVAPAMPVENTQQFKTSAYTYAFDVDIKASPEKVWKLLTTDIDSWWLKDFNSSPLTKAFQLEPKVGGRMFEDFGDDNGVLWGVVVHIEAPRRLQIQGSMFPEYGGPGTYILSAQIEETETGCLLKITDSMFGNVTQETVESTQSGWKTLFGEHLKNKAEEEK